MTNFGDSDELHQSLGGCSSSTRGVCINGSAPSALSSMRYVQFATEGNAADFGDVSTYRRGDTGGSNDTRGFIGGGYDGSNRINTIDYITIASLGNAADFGDLTVARTSSCCSSLYYKGHICWWKSTCLYRCYRIYYNCKYR